MPTGGLKVDDVKPTICARYNKRLENAAQTDNPITPNEAFYDAVGGRIFGGVLGLGTTVLGLGTTSDIFYNPHRPGGSSKGYTPSFISQLRDQVQKMKEHCEERVASVTQSYEMRFAAQEESQRRLEENMLRMMDAVKEHCGDILPSDLFRP